MIAMRHLFAAASLATVGVGLLASTWADEPPFTKGPLPSLKLAIGYPPDATEAQKQEIDLRRIGSGTKDPAILKELLAAFPFESLEDRLQFDAPGRKLLAKSLPAADLELDKWTPRLRSGEWTKIPPATFAALMVEQQHSREASFDRTEGLAALHELEVRKFVTNPGFGFGRMGTFGLRQPPEAPPRDWSEADRGDDVKLPTKGSFFTASSDPKGPTLPSTTALAGFHMTATQGFARPDSWGLVKDKTHVAGFLPHTLDAVRDGNSRQRFDGTNPTKEKLIERWAIRKTELIGLLMHDTPVVYMSPDNKFPTMAGIKDAKTRDLSDFESGGLKNLAAGKEVVVVDATTNQVRMVGAIRMAAACMKCHEGKRGDMLGAFSYDLVRVPAYVVGGK